MRLANSEFKAASAGMDDWAQSADGISAKLGQLKKVLSAQETILASLEQQYEAVAAEQGKGSEAAQLLAIKVNNQKASVEKTRASIKKWEQSLKDVTSEEKQTVSATDELKNTINDQESKLESLKKKYADLILTQGKTSKESRDTAKEIASLSKELQQNKSKMREADSAADDLSESVEDAGNSAEKAEGGFTVLKGALADLLADGIKGVVGALKELGSESQTANNQFQASTGASAEEMEKFSDSIANVYKQNFGESMMDVADARAEVKKQTGEIDPSKLEKMTQNGIALRDTFGYDMSEQMRAVNMLMEQFGLTSDEAFNFFVKGAQNGLDKNGDLLDTINEYSVHYKQQGYSADEFYNSLKNGTESGTFSVDKLGDAMKEFGIRTKDTATTTDEGFELLGLDADKMREKFAKGGESAQEATKQTLEALFSMDDQVKQNQAGVDLFGTMWEDLGVEGVKALMDVSGEAVTTSGAMKELTDIKYDDIGSAFSEIGRTLKVELLQPIVDAIMPALNDLVTWVQENVPAIVQGFKDGFEVLKEWSPLIAGIGAAIATYFVVGQILAFIEAIKSGEVALKLMQGAQAALNLVMSANPIGLIVAAIAGLVAAFAILWNTSDEFREFWIGVWDAIKEAAGVAIQAVSDFFMSAWDAIKEAWATATQFFSDIWESIKETYSVVTKWFSDLFANAWKGIQDAWATVKKWFSDLLKSVQNTWSVVTDWFGNLFKNAWTAIKEAWSSVKKWFSDLLSSVQNVWSVVTQWFSDLFSNAWSGIKTAWSSVKSWFSGIYNGIKDIFRGIVSWFGTLFQNAFTAIKNKFSGWASFWSGLWTQVKNKFSSVGKAIGVAMSNAVKQGINSVLSIVESAINKGIRLINSAINLANKLPGINVGNISQISLPRLEKGGVLKRGQVGLLEGNGAEAVVPLEKNKLWIRQTAKAMTAELNKQGGYGSQSITQNAPVQQVFNQYNTSPKALSRLEIYRQTKNQLRFAKGVT